MLWTVQHLWPAGARFAFNCYRHWAQLLLRHPGELSVTILSKKGITQGEPISMVLYGITLISLAEEPERRIRGSSPRSMPMMRSSMVWRDVAHRS